MCRRCFGACECDICVGEPEEAETESDEGDEARKAMKSKKAMKASREELELASPLSVSFVPRQRPWVAA